MNTERLFWARADVRDEGECWNWQHGKDKDGYGKIRFDGNHWRAHRLAFKFAHGEIPADRLVLHRCDNPSCVNPAHLFLGTQKDNIHDKQAKGREPVGEKNHNAKLTDEQAKYVRHLYFAERHTHVQLADFFKVSTGTIHQIVRGTRYKSAARAAA